MNRSLLALALVLVLCTACSRESTSEGPAIDTRETLRISYVGAPELEVREKPDASSPVIAKYQNGEAVSILVEQPEWVEIRTGTGSGWAKKADLTAAAGKTAQEDDPQPTFRVMPMPVSAPSAHGEVYIEADVNTDGDVVATRLITNTTGSEALGLQNEAALRGAKFHPIVQKGERKPFKYYHRVTY
jgi:uncharacterized protein YgiM (DUF1202 family)